MGLTCSLLGHDYGEPEVVRSREEQGNEVVETVSEVKTCTRCGNEQIVSENTEVRSIREPEEVGIDEDTTRPGESTAETTDGATGEVDHATGAVDDSASEGERTDAESIDDQRIEADTDWPDPTNDGSATADTGSESASTPDAGAAAAETTNAATESEGFADGEFEPPQSAEEDDGIILEETTAEEAGNEQWSSPAGTDDESNEIANADADVDGEYAGGEDAWPDAAGVDEGYDAANPADESDDTDAGVSFGGSLTPSRTEDTTRAVEDEDAELLGSDGSETADQSAETADANAGEGAQAAAAANETASGEDAAEGTGGGQQPDEILVCQECGHEASPERLSLRAGDICPDCHRGYLEPQDLPR